jgi:hypothetical protein
MTEIRNFHTEYEPETRRNPRLTRFALLAALSLAACGRTGLAEPSEETSDPPHESYEPPPALDVPRVESGIRVENQSPADEPALTGEGGNEASGGNGGEGGTDN